MSIRVGFENLPEFYTNLDVIRGRVILDVGRHEQVGAIIVKLEGESKTALGMPSTGVGGAGVSHQDSNATGTIIHENHKILYKVVQAFPDETKAPLPQPIYLAPGHHEYPFQFKIPFNNACSDPAAMARIGGINGAGGGFGSGPFGLGGIRVMDGSRQLMYSHTTKTLPPSFTGFPRMAEIRYYIKVTVQRPGLFKENWRYQVGLKFLPLEPPRPSSSNREAYARRPFTFQARNPSLSPVPGKRGSLFGSRKPSQSFLPSPSPGGEPDGSVSPTPPAAPSIEMSARLPYPSILTCNRPIPLRLIAKKLVNAPGQVNLIALQIDLVGLTHVRTQDLMHTEASRWVILTRQGLSIPVSAPSDAVGAEKVLPDALWADVPLPNTVMPSFVTCNLTREYHLEVKLGLSWTNASANGTAPSASNNPFFPAAMNGKGKGRLDPSSVPQEVHLPLHFSSVEVYSGVAPPPRLVEAMRQGRGRRPGKNQLPGQSLPPNLPSSQAAPPLPARPPANQAHLPPPHQAPQPYDPLYPPQLRPGQAAPSYDEAPPSYDEAMAEEMTGPLLGAQERPAYSGQTNENGPSTIPEKS